MDKIEKFELPAYLTCEKCGSSKFDKIIKDEADHKIFRCAICKYHQHIHKIAISEDEGVLIIESDSKEAKDIKRYMNFRR